MLLDHLDTAIAFVTILLGVSLLIMIITQLISAVLNLRGQSLLYTVKTLLETSGVNLNAEQAKAIAKKALNDKLISDSWFKWFRRVASTVRIEEIKAILDRHVEEAKTWSLTVAAEAESKGKKTRKKTWLLANALSTLEEGMDNVKKHFETWFDHSMDRASERFVMNTRVVTIILSLIFALLLHLDAFTLYDRLSTDAELRASLIASSQTLLDQAEGILSPEMSAVPAAYQIALDSLKVLPDSVITSQIDAAAVAPIRKLGTPATPFISRLDAEFWLNQQLAELNPNARESTIEEYNSIIETKLTKAIDRLKDQARTIKGEFDKTEFKLIPDPYPSWRTYFEGRWVHLWGTLAMTALLSLGAPFWFDALKRLTALRPVLAGKEDTERQQRGNT